MGRELPRAISLCLAALAFFPLALWGVEKLGDYNAWSAYKSADNTGQICFIASSPRSSAGEYSQRGQVFFAVTHRPGLNSRDVVTFIAGYDIKDTTQVFISIDDAKSFLLFPLGDTSWALNEDDRPIVEAMISGDNLEVKGTSFRGVATVDNFSLSGFTAAYRRMSESCQLKPNI